MHIYTRLREMSSANRHDELSEHMAFIASECVSNLGRKLTRQYLRAHSTRTRQAALGKAMKQRTSMTDQAVIQWYHDYTVRQASVQPNLTLSAIERARLTLIDAHDDVQYWIQLMRNHEHHNYKMRITVANHIANTCQIRKDALAAYNNVRQNHDPTIVELTLQACIELGLLHRLRGEMTSPDYAKHQHYDCLQVIVRAEEELDYTIIEVMSLLAFCILKINRYQELQKEALGLADDSIACMYACMRQRSRSELGLYLKEMQPIIRFYRLDVSRETALAVNTAEEVVVQVEDETDWLPIDELPCENSDEESDDQQSFSSSEDSDAPDI